MAQEPAPPSPPAAPLLTVDGLLVVVGGGTVDLSLLADLAASGGHVVAADGGADTVAAAGLVPEAIIGDFDSVRRVEDWLGRTRLIRIAEQETTDFEKVLYSTRAPVTIALGMTGKRFDHTLAALDAVARHARDRIVILVDEADLAMALTGPFSFTVKPGERVSVHPLFPIRFERSTGLAYPLDGIKLAPGVRTGTSNAATDGAFSIVPASRSRTPWLLILPRDYLFGVAAAATARG